MKVLGYIFFVFLVVSCQDIEPVKVPDNLINQTKMEDIIYEIAIVNAARGYDVQKLSKYGVDPEIYVLEKYNIDSIQFAENISYYSSDIEKYKDMYLGIKNRVEGEFTYYDSIAKVKKKIKDSIRLEKAKEKRRERDSIKKADSLVGKISGPKTKKLKSHLPVRVSKEISLDSL